MDMERSASNTTLPGNQEQKRMVLQVKRDITKDLGRLQDTAGSTCKRVENLQESVDKGFTNIAETTRLQWETIGDKLTTEMLRESIVMPIMDQVQRYVDNKLHTPALEKEPREDLQDSLARLIQGQGSLLKDNEDLTVHLKRVEDEVKEIKKQVESIAKSNAAEFKVVKNQGRVIGGRTWTTSQDVEAIKKQGAEMNTTVENSLEELKSEMNTTMGNNLGELKSEMNRQSNRAIDEERKAVKEQGTAIRAEVIGAMKINFGELWASMKKNFGTILEYAEQISRCQESAVAVKMLTKLEKTVAEDAKKSLELTQGLTKGLQKVRRELGEVKTQALKDSELAYAAKKNTQAIRRAIPGAEQVHRERVAARKGTQAATKAETVRAEAYSPEKEELTEGESLWDSSREEVPEAEIEASPPVIDLSSEEGDLDDGNAPAASGDKDALGAVDNGKEEEKSNPQASTQVRSVAGGEEEETGRDPDDENAMTASDDEVYQYMKELDGGKTKEEPNPAAPPEVRDEIGGEEQEAELDETVDGSPVSMVAETPNVRVLGFRGLNDRTSVTAQTHTPLEQRVAERQRDNRAEFARLASNLAAVEGEYEVQRENSVARDQEDAEGEQRAGGEESREDDSQAEETGANDGGKRKTPPTKKTQRVDKKKRTAGKKKVSDSIGVLDRSKKKNGQRNLELS